MSAAVKVKEGDHVIAWYGPMGVGRKIDAQEAARLRRGVAPGPSWGEPDEVTPAIRKIHYYGSGGGCPAASLASVSPPFPLARSIRDTSCRACLMARARQLRGYRWSHEHNAEEVAFLRAELGSRVDGFEVEP